MLLRWDSAIGTGTRNWYFAFSVMLIMITIIIIYIYHALINALSAHMTHINLNMIFYTHVEHSPTKTTHTKHHTERQTD